MKRITIEQRDQYGTKTYHPVCAIAKTFASIAGTKTLTFENLRRIASLGYEIEVKHPETATFN